MRASDGDEARATELEPKPIAAAPAE
jgi:hypothetical protein